MRKFFKFIIPILILGLFLNMPDFSHGQNETEQNQEVRQINKEIQEKKDRIKKMQDQQAVYQGLIKQKQGEKASLNNQLAILENRLAKAALDIESAQTEIDRTNLEIEKVNLEIKDKDRQIFKQKEHIASVIKLMQKQDDKSTLEILLLNGTLNEFVSQVKYLEDINKEIGQSLGILKQYKKDLENQQKNLNDKKHELTEFLFKDELSYDAELLIWKKLDKRQVKENLQVIYDLLEKISASDWLKENIEKDIINYLKQKELKVGDYLWPMRAALTGLKASPGPFEVAEVLGKEESLKRINQAIKKL